MTEMQPKTHRVGFVFFHENYEGETTVYWSKGSDYLRGLDLRLNPTGPGIVKVNSLPRIGEGVYVSEDMFWLVRGPGLNEADDDIFDVDIKVANVVYAFVDLFPLERAVEDEVTVFLRLNDND